MKKLLLILILFLTACRLMALPEVQRDTCVKAIHSWHVERVTRINAMTVPDEIKAEMIAFSAQDETRQLGEVCDVDRPPAQLVKRP